MWKFIKNIVIVLLFLGLIGFFVSDNEKETKQPEDKTEQNQKAKKKELWHKNYDGTKYNNSLVQIKNADLYNNNPVLNKSFKSVDDIEYEIKHIEISTKIKGLNGQVHTAPKGYSFLVASCTVKNTSSVDTEMMRPSIHFIKDKEDMIKDEYIYYDEKQEKWVNDSEQMNIIYCKPNSLKSGQTKDVNLIYQIATDNVRYTTISDETGSLNFYSDLNSACLGFEDSVTNINACLQDQQEK